MYINYVFLIRQISDHKFSCYIVCQELDHLLRRASGRYGRIFRPEALEDGFNGEEIGPFFAHTASSTYFNNRKVSIYGGSNEIQKNIISKMIVGL